MISDKTGNSSHKHSKRGEPSDDGRPFCYCTYTNNRKKVCIYDNR